MTRSFIIQERIPNSLPLEKLLEELGWEILERLEGLDTPDLDLDLINGWVQVMISGPDEVIAENLIIKSYGRMPESDKLEVGNAFKGFIADLGKVGYGIYFRVSTPGKDALYPLFKMRSQLAMERKAPVRKIVRAYGLINDLALELELIKRDEKGIYVSLSSKQLSTIESWVRRGVDVLFIVGATPKQVKRALLRTGHRRDVSIMRASFLSHALICKKGTQARGLIPRLGPYLPRATLSILLATRVKKLLSE